MATAVNATPKEFRRPETIGPVGRKSPHFHAYEAVNEQKEKDAEVAAQAFDQVDTNRVGSVTGDEVREILKKILPMNCQVDDYGFNLVMDCAHKKAMDNKTISVDSTTGALPKAEVLEAIRKYRYYLANAKEYMDMYNGFDEEDVGTVNQLHLKLVMDSIKREDENDELTDEQKLFGEIFLFQSSIFNDDLFVEDIEFCASECHIQDGGMINKSELLPMIATWDMLAKKYKERQQNHPFCTIQ